MKNIPQLSTTCWHLNMWSTEVSLGNGSEENFTLPGKKISTQPLLISKDKQKQIKKMCIRKLFSNTVEMHLRQY